MSTTPSSSSYSHYNNNISYEDGGRRRRSGNGSLTNEHNSHVASTAAPATSSTSIGLMGIGNSLQNHEAQVRAMQRLNQIKDEQTHNAVVDQKMKDLLVKKLDILRSYIYEMEADNWKYEGR